MLGISEKGMTKIDDKEETMPITIGCAIDKMMDTAKEEQTPRS
jgi:hypothetical protein